MRKSTSKLAIQTALVLAARIEPNKKVWYKKIEIWLSTIPAIIGLILSIVALMQDQRIKDQKKALEDYIMQSNGYNFSQTLSTLESIKPHSLDSTAFVSWVNSVKPLFAKEISNTYLARDSAMKLYWMYAYKRLIKYEYIDEKHHVYYDPTGTPNVETYHDTKNMNKLSFFECYGVVEDAITVATKYIRVHNPELVYNGISKPIKIHKIWKYPQADKGKP